MTGEIIGCLITMGILLSPVIFEYGRDFLEDCRDALRELFFGTVD